MRVEILVPQRSISRFYPAVATAAHHPPTLTFERAWQDFVAHRRARCLIGPG
jgi:hypothetical protein